MKFKITEDGNFVQAIDYTLLEYEQLESSFTKKAENYFILKKKRPHWDGDIKFVDRFGRIPKGLWQEIINMGKKYQITIEIEGAEKLINQEYSEADFDNWLTAHFKNSTITPRYYQIEAAKKILKYANCTGEISTSGGKTLIAYLIFSYLFHTGKIKKMLYVVPNLSLIEQSEDKFFEYDQKCGIDTPLWKSICVFGGSKQKFEDTINIVFGTYQTLTKKDLNYFKEFGAVFIDECLHPDTLITMSDFSKKKIKDINIGEKVWTYNEDKLIYEIKEVEYVYKNLSINNQVYELETETGQIIKITGNHKVLTSNNLWKRVDELSIEDDIISFNLMDIH